MSQPLHGAEPPMYLQRPSSARSQDIAHILAHTFRELFTRDSVGQDTVQYLNKSRGGEDVYHEQYVDSLQKVQEERERRLAEVAMLERHIMQAQARAMSADERALNRVASAHSQFPDLGLPPSRSHFRSCIDTELLRDFNLLTPEDFATEEPPIVPPPQRTPSAAPYLRQTSSLNSHGSAPSLPAYTRDTVTSTKKRQDDIMVMNTPLPPLDRSVHSSLSSDSGDASLPSPRGGLVGQSQVGTRAWEQQANPEVREGQRVALNNLQAKVDYLKNPRHAPPSRGGHSTLIKSKRKVPKEVGIKAKQEQQSLPENSPVFLPSPPVIRFSDYNVGQVYEMTLELKNVTRAMRPVRIVPPRTTYFSVGLGQFPGEQGLVAPGMSCRYTMRFSPDSLSDYDDYVTVQTQAAAPLIVPLQGRRPPPVITLPEDVSVGQCLVGGCKISRLMIQNEGGPGRFCMMKRESWPASNFKRTVATSSVHMPPFEVRPAVFELDRGAKTIIEVLFSPGSTETYKQQMTMVCDNCQVKHFTITGEGQTPGVDLVSMEGGLSAAAPGELCDVTAQHMVTFDPLNPYTYYQRALHVRNLANVELPFSWVVVKPLLQPPDPEAEDEKRSGAQERIQDVDSGFSIEPPTGMLPANSVAEFMVTFAPPQIQKYHSVLHLILRDIPRPKMASIERPASATSDGIAEIMLPTATTSGAGGTGGTVTHDLTALEVEFKGECQPFSVMLQPYAVYLPGQILVETSVKRQFRMINTSVSSVLFQWDKVHCHEYIMEVEPPVGELGPQEELEFDLTVSGSSPGHIEHTILCHVQHLEEPLMLHVHAEVKGPEVQIENSDVNFGLVRLGDKAEQTLRIHNLCQVSAMWLIRESPEHNKFDSEFPEFVFSPPGGELRPLETLDVTVTFMPRRSQSLRSVFEVLVQDGSQSPNFTQHAVMARGEVQAPEACLLSCQITLDDVYLDVTSLHGAYLLNQTLLPTRFQWGQAEGADAEVCSVTMEPATASLGPREQVPIAVNFTAHRPGPVTDLRVACHVAGMDAPLYLAITGDVLGLRVIYTTSTSPDSNLSAEEAEQDLLLDLGTVHLSETPRRYLHISNKSAISAPFSLLVDNFSAKPPTPPEGKPQGHMPNKGSQRRALIGRVSTLAPYEVRSAGGARADPSRAMLGAGRGAAFLLTPAHGILQPFSTQVVEVTGFADMWGQYSDTLHCRVENLPVQKVPITMNVTGCPLQFQMMAVQSAKKPILRFGTHISGVKPVVRQMRINNLSPFDIRLDWQVFNDDTSSKQLLDLVTTFGSPFPLRNPDGSEIVPEEDVESEYSTSEDEEEELPNIRPRLPTDMIANSPSTTPAMSREPTSTHDTVFSVATPHPMIPSASGPPTTARASPRPKVISVTLREHNGIGSQTPYQIQQDQLVIPAKGSNNINVTLTPLSETEVTSGTECVAYALGYMSLMEQVAEVDGQVTRPQAFDVSPLRLDMTAHVKPALLTIECTEEEGMQYQAAASDLLHNKKEMREVALRAENLRLCSARLANNTETPLVFRLVTSSPFCLVHLDPATKRPLAQTLETDEHTLHPRHNMMVQVGFRQSPDLFEFVEKLTENPEEDGVKLEVRGHERKLHFDQNLVIQFNNNTCQRLPLSASLTIPALVLSLSELDFGTCLVGQRRELQLELSNPTGSASDWTTAIESKSGTCVKDTFAMTPDAGTLDAYITYVSKSKTLIKVFFTAKHTEDYEIIYRFQGMLGETPCCLRVRGQGSYDGKHEAVVNV